MATTTFALVGAEVLDGTGAAAVPRDVLVSDGRIVDVTAPRAFAGRSIPQIDLTGLTLAPGFIDVHSHADNAPFLDTDDLSKVMQGVTTEIVGNCGFSLIAGVADPHPQFTAVAHQFFPADAPLFGSWAEMFEALDEAGMVTNQAFLVGHGTLRAAVMGMTSAAPGDDELRAMTSALESALEFGAVGLSTGLIYAPGSGAKTDEIVRLADVLSRRHPYVTHLRGEGRQLLRSISEAIDIAQAANCPLHVSHLKAAGRQNWGRIPDVLQTLDSARDRGLDVRQDVYPYTAGSTMLAAVLPPEWRQADVGNILHRLREPESVAALTMRLAEPADDWENLVGENGWDRIVLASSSVQAAVGRSLAQLADSAGVEPAQVLVDLLLADELRTGMIIHSIHVDDLAAAVSHPHTMIGSDGLPPGLDGLPHPRMYGTFPRVLARLARDGGALSLPEAIRRITALPASAFGLRNRGRIVTGGVADLVAFSPADVRDTATYESPRRHPEGIALVMIDGVPVVRDGRFLGARRGRRLRFDAL